MSKFLLGKKKVMGTVECLLADAGTSNLLVPMSGVAEVIHNQDVELDENAPPWVAGWVEWRKLRIPVIEFFALQENRGAQNFDERTKLMVMNSISDAGGIHFYAIYTRDFPRILKLQEDTQLDSVGNNFPDNCIEMCINYDNQRINLPNFENVEARLQQISQPH